MAKLLRRLFKKIPFVEALRAFLEQWGIWQWITAGAAVVIAALISAWAWLDSNLPAWGMAVLYLTVLVLIIVGANYAVQLYRKFAAERLDHMAIANDLIRLGDEMRRLIDDYAREQARHNNSRSLPVVADPRREWEAKNLENDLMVKHIAERVGSRIMASTMLLSKLEVRVPFHLSHVSIHTMMGLASYFGAVGHLIKSGNLPVAQKLDDQTAWTLSGIVG